MRVLPATKCAFLVSVAASVSFIAATVFGQGQTATVDPSLAESVTARVDKLFAQWDRSDSPGCSLGVSRNGAVVYERGYGMANLEQRRAITPASIFPIASISKQFTAMAILMLAQRGQLSLDDDVRKYITELPDYGSRITLRHLLTHTSGLRQGFQLLRLAGWRDGDVQTNDDIVKILARQKALTFTPGTEYQYNNAGYTLLAVIVERVSSQSLQAFSDANIFKPLGMTHTHIHDDPSMIVPNHPSGYYVRSLGDGRGFPGDRMSEADLQDLHVATETGSHTVGSGGVYATMRDLLLWEQNFADVRVGDPALVAAMQTPNVLADGETSGYGFGLQVGRYRGLREIGHGGSNVGFDLHVNRYPHQGLAVAVLCNLENINSHTLAHGVADIYLADVFPAQAASNETAVPPRLSLSAKQLAHWVGLYHNPSTSALRRIFVRDGKLMANASMDVLGGTELTPVSANHFLFPWGTAVEFVPATGSQAQELRELAEGQKPLGFLRVDPFAPSSTELQAFAGEYTSPELDVTYMVTPQDSGLLIQPSRGTGYPLRPTFTDSFQEGAVGRPFIRGIGVMFDLSIGVSFTRDAGGMVTGLLVHAGIVRHVRVRFERMKRRTTSAALSAG